MSKPVCTVNIHLDTGAVFTHKHNNNAPKNALQRAQTVWKSNVNPEASDSNVWLGVERIEIILGSE